jgi:hypothetical protein
MSPRVHDVKPQSRSRDQAFVNVRNATPVSTIANALWSFWRKGRPVERAAYIVGVLLLASGLIHFGILVMTGASWDGPLSFRKATTFGLSFGLTLITIVWVANFLRLGDRSRAVVLGTFTVACALETVLVTLQVWRGVPSHFNLETRFDALVARGLAGGGFALVAIIGTLLVVAFRRNPTVPISLRIAIRVGFVALFTSLVVGAVMIATGMLLVFRGNPEAAYATGGTLKPTHAVTMHAILLLPLLAWLLSFVDWSERRRVSVVLLGAAGYALAAGVVAAENVAGLPFSNAPLGLDALLMAGFFGLTAAGVLALNRAARGSDARGIEH